MLCKFYKVANIKVVKSNIVRLIVNGLTAASFTRVRQQSKFNKY